MIRTFLALAAAFVLAGVAQIGAAQAAAQDRYAPNGDVRIHGMKDTALNAAGHSGTWDHVDADTTIVMFPDAGHFVQHDARDQVNRTVRDWLAARC